MDLDTQFVQLARFALTDDRDNVVALIRRALKPLLRRRPDLSQQAKAVLALTTNGGPVRSAFAKPLPVDSDSRLELLRRESVVSIEPEPVWPPDIEMEFSTVLEEHLRSTELRAAGLVPTRSMLFVGKPGVGKTLAARWLACSLQRPLLTLDLAAVMSSFLGRTGNNVRIVLDYAQKSPSILLLDEFDAIAKRRDDATEIGELKRLVTVLLQEIDEWPQGGLLLAATNHPELLDPAVWRRFDRVVEFPLPSISDIKKAIPRMIATAVQSDELLDALAIVLYGDSFAEITRSLNTARRKGFLSGEDINESLIQLVSQRCNKLTRRKKLDIARSLGRVGCSQRGISRLTGIARDTLRKHLKAK